MNFSVREALWKAEEATRKKKLLGVFFGSAGSVIAVLLLFENLFHASIVASIALGCGVFVAAYVATFLFFFLRYILKYLLFRRRESIYGDAILVLKDAFAKVHWLRRNAKITDQLFKESLAYVCDQLKTIFDKKTGSECSVSIKLAIGTDVTAETEVVNFCRDKKSRTRDTEDYKNVRHHIFKNSCFNHIFTEFSEGKVERPFYKNDAISKDQHYQNTSREAYTDGKLPYDSEIVVPLSPAYQDNETNLKMLGFLCIDSPSNRVFDDKYDIGMIQGVADGIYDVVEQYIQNQGK